MQQATFDTALNPTYDCNGYGVGVRSPKPNTFIPSIAPQPMFYYPLPNPMDKSLPVHIS
jgi:hypothetical protein